MKINKLVSVMLLFFTIAIAFSQTTYKGTIFDKDGLPIMGVSIIASENNEVGTVSDFDGNFNIRLNNPKVKVSFVGYQTKEVVLLKVHNKITLLEGAQNLDEVIVSASREAQQRKDVPAAIGLVTAKNIKETKAFGIDQLVNQIPGVYMSSSMSASNEQHMMAIRTPISTKALFLYLEDGLPIRPVAVFNHNALLEMNNTTFGKVEILKGPASSIYGSEAIGGSINFITKNPRKEFGGSIGIEANTLGLQKIQVEASVTAADKYGFYIGAHKIRRINGLIEHSDYDKFAVTFKNVNDFSQAIRWTNTATFIDFITDMGSSSLSEENYKAGKYESNHTFANREAKTLRFRSTLDVTWSDTNKTAFNLIYRDNEMNQIPSYRIYPSSPFGEINANTFESIVGLIQHKLDFNFADASLIVGGTLDYSPQDYYAKNIKVTYDTNSKKFTNYKPLDSYRMFYQADILNYAGYTQFEISPFDNLKLTAAVRYDKFIYDYDNKDEGKSGVKDQKVTYDNIAPKVGFNFNFSEKSGFYANYSKGFTPPQIGSLFRNRGLNGEAYELKPAKFNNYEVGGYISLGTIKLDVALYRLDGKNRFVTTTDSVGNYISQNAGETRSQGVELGFNWKILDNLTLDYSGSYATHTYLKFTEAVLKDKKTRTYFTIDHSNSDMPTAPNYIATASLKYKPIKDLLLTFQHEQVGKYNTSFENQVLLGKDNNGKSILGTSVYNGHHLFNFKVNYTYKHFDIWAQGLNLFDKLYSTRVSYRRGANSYSVGAPRAFHFGISYNF